MTTEDAEVARRSQRKARASASPPQTVSGIGHPGILVGGEEYGRASRDAHLRREELRRRWGTRGLGAVDWRMRRMRGFFPFGKLRVRMTC
jgi:hypothetical protein